MQPLLLLHGAIGASGQLQALAGRLGSSYIVHTLDFSGHGGRPHDGPFSIDLFEGDMLQFMDERGLADIAVFGYSMGGYAAMHFAKKHPERITKLVTLATKYHWDEATAAKETQMLDAAVIEQKLPAFAATLRQRHAPGDWKEVLAKTAALLTWLGSHNPLNPAACASITTPTLLLLGDHDKMVTLGETVAVYKALPNAQLGILPDTKHPIEQVDTDLLGYMLGRFLQ